MRTFCDINIEEHINRMTISDDRQWELLLDRLEASGDNLEPSDAPDEVSEGKERLGDLMVQAVSRRAAKDNAPDIDAEWKKFASTVGVGQPDIASEESSKAEEEEPSVRPRRYYIILSIAASLLVLIVVGAMYLFHNSADAPIDKVIAYKPSKVVTDKPTITTSSGRTIVLPTAQGNASVDNKNTKAQQHLLSALGLDTDTPVEENVTLAIPSGKSGEMVLSDGTHVWLYAGSTITYPVNFHGNRRVVYLQGQAHFEVHHDASKPFVIVTDQLNATVLGTELNVSCYQGEDAHVALLNGVVEVTAKASGSTVRLHPGQGTSVSSMGKQTIAEEDMETYTYWKQGFLYFNDAPLSDIAAQFSRWYKVRVIFDEPRLRTQRYRFFCPRTEPATRAIELLNHFDNIHATLSADGLHIK